MKHLKSGLVLLLGVALIALGCSSDDDGGGTNVSNLTPQEQDAMLQQFGVDMPTMAATMMPLAMMSVSGGFFDGVSEDDFSGFDLGGFGFLGMRMVGLDDIAVAGSRNAATAGVTLGDHVAELIRRAAAQDEINVSYDTEKGWWFATAAISVQEVVEGQSINMTLNLADSLRFEDGSQNAMQDPGEMTDRFLHGYSLGLLLDVLANDEGLSMDIELDVDLTGNADVTGLTTALVDMTGGSVINVGTDANIVVDQPEIDPVNMDVDGTVSMNAGVDGFRFAPPTNPEIDPCPTDGMMTAGIDLDLDVRQNTERLQAVGGWDMSVDITSQGLADVTVSSGSYSRSQQNLPICTAK
jgi:hypothetical protein